jgi:hypothetical protein
MDTFTPTQWNNARDYVFAHGRALEQARFAFHFEEGSEAAVIAALAEFQNLDGGFGQAIEPDIRTPASSVIGTSTAFHILREIGIEPKHPMVKEAVDYLTAEYDESERVWPIVPPEVEDAPHAPWWFYESSRETFGGFLHNPRAEVLGHLYHFECPINGGFLDVVIDGLNSLPDRMELYDTRSYLGLASAKGLPNEKRAALDALLGKRLPLTIASDPDAWAGHGGLLPLAAAPLPESYAAAFIDADLIDANLDFVIASQNKDGSWAVSWEWAAFGAEAWAQAEQDWKGILILDALRSLKGYGRA